MLLLNAAMVAVVVVVVEVEAEGEEEGELLQVFLKSS